MFKCCDCGLIFKEPKKCVMDCGEEFYQVWNGCPECEGTYEELKQCDLCGEWVEDLTDTYGMVNGSVGKVCDHCLENYDIGGE